MLHWIYKVKISEDKVAVGDLIVPRSQFDKDLNITLLMETVEEVEQFYLERDAVAEEIEANSIGK